MKPKICRRYFVSTGYIWCVVFEGLGHCSVYPCFDWRDAIAFALREGIYKWV